MDHYPEFKTFEVASEPPPGLPGATRLIAKPTIAKGSADFVPLKDYLSVAICNFENLTNWEDSAAGSDQLKLHFRLSGSASYSLTDHDDFEVHKLTAAALFQPHDVIKKEVYFADNREKSVTVFCRIADYLASNNIPHSAIPDSMAFLLTNDTPDFFYVDFAMNAEIHQATEALVSMNVEGELRALFVEAKTNELICLFLQALKSLEDASSTAVRLSKQDLANLHSARSILDTQYADAPTIIQLARKVGVNKQKLTRGFKYIFGLTVYDYLLSVRMARARTLLLETELSITQIALEVGYEYAGNFTTAFKRYFGVPPNVMRKGK
jgi:AraC-like DNA-binding protein